MNLLRKKLCIIGIASLTALLTCFQSGCMEKNKEEAMYELDVEDSKAEKPDTSEIKADATATPEQTPTPKPTEVPTATMTTNNAAGKTPFEIHGKLSVEGTRIVDKDGNVTRLCGVSTHGLQWFPEYVNKDSFKSLRDDFGANTVRLAMYTVEGGYCESGDKAAIKKTLTDGVNYATSLGMYSIIDWHILHDLDPNVHKNEAIAFFDEMSKKYADNDAVIYEICNEPNGGTTWEQIQSYANEVIPVIKANNPDAIIVVGTPNWSQNVDDCISNPITGYSNIMYTVHFYADTHKDDIRNKVVKAEEAGLPVFITEFSICDASGNGSNNINEANKWMELLDKYDISFCAWNLSNKHESSSLIDSGCTKLSGWTQGDLSESGKWLVEQFATRSDNGSGIVNATSGNDVVTQGSEGSNTANENDNNANSNENNQNNTAGTTSNAPSVSGSKDDINVKLDSTNSWNDGSSEFTQISVTITNNGATVNNWEIEVDMNTAVTIDQFWCCKATANGNKLVITPETYNASIKGGETTKDIGFIVKTASKPSNITVTVK